MEWEGKDKKGKGGLNAPLNITKAKGSVPYPGILAMCPTVVKSVTLPP